MGEIVYHHAQGVILRGPFSGTTLPPVLRWGKADLGGMLLGLYESEVVDAVARHTLDKHVLVDVGAADGFFILGRSLPGRLTGPSVSKVMTRAFLLSRRGSA